MKERFTTIDVFSVLQDLRESLLGMRVANVYDVDHKTYLIRLAKPDVKKVLLFESGCRIHTTEFEWPKSMEPSGFSMKLRKHLRTRRLVAITQLGIDRVVDLQFGSDHAAYHLIIELYDRGNVILTDCDYLILSLLRTRTDADADIRFAVREKFSQDTIKQDHLLPSRDQLDQAISEAKKGESLKSVLNPHFVYGSALLSHCLLGAGIRDSAKIGSSDFSPTTSDMSKLMAAVEEAEHLFRTLREGKSQGILIQRREERIPGVSDRASGGPGEDDDPLVTNVEFHPMLFRQHEACPYKEFPTFSKAVDEFFSSRSSQKQDLKAINAQKTAVKKLDNVRRDHLKRIDDLQNKQEEDRHKAQLIEYNVDLVERACTVIRSAVANAMDWGDIELLVKDAQARGDPVAMAIHSLKLASNEVTLLLREPAEEVEASSQEEVRSKKKKQSMRGSKIDIDLGLSAFSNARRYYDHKKSAFKKEQKTIAASEKALKSAEKKTKQTLKDASTIAKIRKARKIHWFEKFFWFISSENYLVIGGRDQQQNEQVVKRYLNEGDLYVHADLHGAPSVIIKNGRGGVIPPRTLLEAGGMAVCYSSAWESRFVTSAWWVHSHQVSKTAPSGEYLTTGSFMIRGKKNFLPPCDLTMGFGFLFKVDETCIPLHLHERKIALDDQSSVVSDSMSELTVQDSVDREDEEEVEIQDTHELGEEEEKEEEEEEEEEESYFPDTVITLTHIGGGKFQLKGGMSEISTRKSLDAERERVQREMEEAGEKGRQEKRHQHLSAKQRRDMKKQAKQGELSHDNPAPPLPPPPPSSNQSKKKRGDHPPQPTPQPQAKRGQKAKQKKMRDKYGDQDEEERQMRMEILASGRPSKPQPQPQLKTSGKKGQKVKKNPNQPSNPKQKYRQRQKERESQPATADTSLHKQMDPLFVNTSHTVNSERREEEEEEGKNRGGRGEVDEEEKREQEMKGVDERDGENVTEFPTEENITIEDNIEDRLEAVDGEEGGMAAEKESREEKEDDYETFENIEDGTNDVREEGTIEMIVEEDEGRGEGRRDQIIEGEEKSEVNLQSSEGATATSTDAAAEESDDEEKRVLLAEENIQQLDESEKDQLSVLDSFTGCPVPDDILIYAIPVCAPYTAIISYKHRVKLVPGTNKRGKAARAALHRFIQSRDSSQREKDLLKSVKDNDLSRYIPGKVKISIPQTQTQRRPHK